MGGLEIVHPFTQELRVRQALARMGEHGVGGIKADQFRERKALS